jgi:hypothetical protein
MRALLLIEREQWLPRLIRVCKRCRLFVRRAGYIGHPIRALHLDRFQCQ